MGTTGRGSVKDGIRGPFTPVDFPSAPATGAPATGAVGINDQGQITGSYQRRRRGRPTRRTPAPIPAHPIDALTAATYLPPSKRFDVTHRIDSTNTA